MKTRLTQLFLITILLWAFDSVHAQNVAFERSNFPDDKKGYKDAVNNIETGDSYFYNGDYTMYIAIDYYNDNLNDHDINSYNHNDNSNNNYCQYE